MMQREVILLTGQTGSGKSYKAKQMMQRVNRCIIFDAMEEYGPGYYVYSYGEFVEYFQSYGTEGNFRIILRQLSDDDLLSVMAALPVIGDLYFFVEEISMAFSPQAPPPEFRALVKTGRHNKISLVIIGQRVPDVNTETRAQITCNIAFYQSEPLDIQRLLSYGFRESDILDLDKSKFEYAMLGESPLL